MAKTLNEGRMHYQPFWTPLRKAVFALFFFIIGAGPLAKGVIGLYEASQNRLAVQQERQSRIDAFRKEKSRVERSASELRESVLAPPPAVLAEGRGPTDADRQRYWSLEGDKAYLDAKIWHEEAALKRAEKAADAVPFFIGLVALGLAIWTLWFIILYRVIPKSKKALVFVSTQELDKLP